MRPTPLPKFVLHLIIGWTAVIPFAAHADWAQQTLVSSFIVVPPPAPGSAAERKDFEIMLKAQQTRNPQDCALGQRQSWPKVSAFWKNSVLTPAEYARAEKKIEKVGQVAERVADYYKRKIQRPRPYSTDSRIHPCVSNPPTGELAYPSTHAAVATATGCILAQMYPNKRSQILQSADYFSDLRFIIGVHHPSDVEAGKKIGAEVCARAR